MKDWFDSPSGHIVLMFTLVLVGLTAARLNMAQGNEIITFALGAMARSMLGGTVKQEPPKGPNA